MLKVSLLQVIASPGAKYFVALNNKTFKKFNYYFQTPLLHVRVADNCLD